ncbi:MAG TPA: CheR family methyltransferase [bacterium]|nr:CheR family methyltransferase [bacterium]HMW34077.1 CheR family methyltransferase [bacterium]HMW36755.1 CheR family methyltransferase [bacterium]HMY36099.1 CheR family methyltransferase [bacterium]HND75728.1 CheR family methyltransferase [bacterium]
MQQEFTRALFETFRKTILDFCGIAIPDDSRSELERKIRERMTQTGFSDFYSYHVHIAGREAGEDELRKFIESITNNETYFFREPAHFRVLKSHIVPELLRKKKERRIRVWSAGCSTGEEAYTIAISLFETRMLLGDFEIEVLATDIDRNALTIAQLGNFGRNSFRAIDPSYLNTYFRIPDQRLMDYRIIDERIRAITRFEYLNLFDDHYPDYLHDIDVIFFRNVSIYFPKDKIQSVNRRLSEVLNESGYLFLGSSETLHHNFGHLDLVDYDGVFLYQKKTGTEEKSKKTIAPSLHESKRHHRPVSPKESAKPQTPRSASSRTKPEAPPSLDQIFAMYKDGAYAQILALWDMHGDGLEPKIPFLILKAFIYIGQEDFDLARKTCDAMMALDALNAEVYFLSGLVDYHAGQFAAATEKLKKALFLKKDLAMAHYYLASVYRQSGKTDDARREFRNTIKILEHKQDTSVSFLAQGYSSDYLINACKQYLK